MSQSNEKEIRRINWNGAELRIQEVTGRGWEGILYRRLDGAGYLLAFLEWRNGGYLERFRPISGEELDTWMQDS
ncbi:MAG: hypothetical protein CMN76_11920 [Spirochaetaceae bacterium]|nr:hypothetical protein [Spirochaetaceae bacterium]